MFVVHHWKLSAAVIGPRINCASAWMDPFFPPVHHASNASPAPAELWIISGVLAGRWEMEWEESCQACDLRDCVSFVALMKGLLVCRWYQPRSHSRPLTTSPPQKYGLNLKSPLMPPVRSGEKEHLRVSLAAPLLAAPSTKRGWRGAEKRSH